MISEQKSSFRSHTGDELNAWIAEVNHSVIEDLKSFSIGLLPDLHSIENVINIYWSSGLVENDVNQLKTIKCQNVWKGKLRFTQKNWYWHRIDHQKRVRPPSLNIHHSAKV